MKYKLVILIILLALNFVIIYSDQIIDTTLFTFNRKVDNNYIKENTLQINPEYFRNFFALDTSYYEKGDFFYGVGIDKGKNVAYYFDTNLKTNYFGVDNNKNKWALKYMDKVSVTKKGKIFVIDSITDEIYFWDINGKNYKPTGKINYTFKELEDIFYDDNEILYILDDYDLRVYKYSITEDRLLYFPDGRLYIPLRYRASGSWGDPVGLCVYQSDIFIIFEHSAILKLDSYGNYSNHYIINKNNLGLKMYRSKKKSETWLTSIAIGLDGNVFVLDSNDGKIHIFNNNLEYITSWYDPKNTIEKTATDICFEKNYNYLFISHPWGFYMYELNTNCAIIELDNSFIYPTLINEEYPGITITASSISAITLDAYVKTGDSEIKIMDNVTIVPGEDFTYTWDGTAISNSPVPYGDYTLLFYSDGEPVKKNPVSVKQAPVLTVFNTDGEIIDNTNREIDYSYQAVDPGYLKISVSSPKDNPLSGNEWETFLYEGQVSAGYYNRVITDTLNDEELPDDYYSVNFYLLPLELTEYFFDSTRRGRIFVVNKHDLEMGEIINSSAGFNPHNPEMAAQAAGFFLSEGAYISCDILNENSDITYTLCTHVYVPSGEQVLTWDGFDINRMLVLDGEYAFYVKAEQDYIGTVKEDTGNLFILDTTPAVIDLLDGDEITYISPDETSSVGIKDSFSTEFLFNETVDVECYVKDNQGGVVKILPGYTGLLPSAIGTATWDGSGDTPPEPCVADGRYRLVIDFIESFGNRATKNITVFVDNNELEEAPAEENVFALNTFPVNTITPDNQFSPAIAKVGDNYVIAWQSEQATSTGYDYDIYARAFDAHFHPLGQEFRVNSYISNDQVQPAITAITGGFVIAWNSYGQDGSEEGVYFRRFNTDFQAVGNETRANMTTKYAQEHPAITGIEGGFAIVWGSTWHDDPDIDTTISARIFDNTGTPLGKEFYITTTPATEYAFLPDIAQVPEGFVATWEEGAGNYNVYARKYYHEDHALGAVFPVFTDDTTFNGRPAAACLADGFIITWISDAGENGFETYGQKFDAGCNKEGDVFKINTTGHSYRFNPQVNTINNGCIVTWHSDIPGKETSAVCATVLDNNCNIIIDEFRVSEFDLNLAIEYDQLNTAIETGTGFIICWQSDIDDGYDLFAKSYEIHSMPEGLNLAAEILSPSDNPYIAQENFSIQGIASDAYMERYDLSLREGNNSQLLKSEYGKNVIGELYFFNILSCEKGTNYTVSLEAWDKAGNYREDTLNITRAPDDDEFIESFTIDSYYHSDAHPPLVSFTMQDSSYVTFKIIDKNGIVERTFYLGLVPEAVTDHPLDISGLADNEYYLHFIVQNSVMGEFESKLTFVIDNTDPAVSISDFGCYFSVQEDIHIPARVVEKHIKTISMTCLDENGTPVKTLVETNLLYELSEAAFNPGSYPEGSYTIVLFAEDLAGNTNLCEYPLLIDRTAPAIQFTSPDFLTIFTKTVIIDAIITDTCGVSEYSVSFKNREQETLFTGNTSHLYHEWDTTILQETVVEGTIIFTIYDNAGNKAVIEKPVIIDNNPPEIELIYESEPILINGEQYTNAQNTLYINAPTRDNYSFTENIYYALTPGSWVEYTEPLQFTDEDLYSLECYAMDNVGNASPVIKDSFIVDAYAPLYTVTIGEPVYVNGDDIFIPLENNILIEAVDSTGEYRSGLKNIEYRVADGLWKDYEVDGIKIYSEGPKDIYIKVTDNVDNILSEYIGTYIVDIAPPFTTFSADGNFYYSYERDIIALGSAADITLEATDLGVAEYASGVYKTYYVLDNIENEYTEPFFIEEGDVLDFHFYSIDNVGNTEQRDPVHIAVDILPPEISLFAEHFILENEDVIYSKSGNLFGFTANDNFAGVKDIFYKFDDEEYTLYTGTFGLNEGADVVLAFYAEDYLVQKSEVVVKRVVIDDTPPVTEMATSLPLIEINGSLYADSRYIFSWSAYDTRCGVSETIVTIDGIALQTDPLEYVFTEEGEHAIEYYSIDNLGNIEGIHEAIIITPIPDMTPPVSTIVPSYESYNDGNMDYFRSDIVFTIDAVDLLNENESYASGVDSIIYAIDGGEEVTYQGENIVFSTEGLHEIMFHAIDLAGNIEQANFFFFIIDDTPPESELTAPDSGNIFIGDVLYITESFSIEIIAEDEYCGVKEIFYKINTTSVWETYTVPLNLEPGDYEVWYYAIDNLGNTEEKKSISIKVITDYNIISYKTAGTQIMSHNTKGYDLFCNTDKSIIGYLKGTKEKEHIFIKNLKNNHGSVFSHGNKVSLRPEERLEIELCGTYIATTEIRNNSRDIFLYTREGRNQEGIRLSSDGGNSSPVIMGNKVYWIHNEAGTYNIVEYDIIQYIDAVLFISDYPVQDIKRSGTILTFIQSGPYNDTIYGYENNVLKVLFEKQTMSDEERIIEYSLYNNLLVTEDMINGEHVLSLYRMDMETLLIDSFTGKNPHSMDNYILYVEEIEECEVLFYYNIINKVKTGITKGKEISGLILGSCGDIIVEREYSPWMHMNHSGDNHKRHHSWYDFIFRFRVKQLLYLKYMDDEEYVHNITYSTGAKAFAYNKYYDYEDFIYADKCSTFAELQWPFKNEWSSTFSKNIPFPRVHHIQAFAGDIGNTDENYLTFLAKKDIIVFVVWEKDNNGLYSNNHNHHNHHDYSGHTPHDKYDEFSRCFNGRPFEYYEINAEEYFSINGPGPESLPPLIFIIEAPGDSPH